MHYVLSGFSQEAGFRVFLFEGVAGDWARTKFRVRIDLALIRAYGIRTQELPLLCRGLLERRVDDARTLTYTEADMRTHAGACAAKADEALLQKRRVPRRPPPQRPQNVIRATN